MHVAFLSQIYQPVQHKPTLLTNKSETQESPKTSIKKTNSSSKDKQDKQELRSKAVARN